MKIIDNQKHIKHAPFWKFILGNEVYQVKDIPDRVTSIKRELEKNKNFEIISPREFPAKHISDLHSYFDFLKETSERAPETAEIYPDLFPGEGARIEKKLNPLWGGLYCTDCVTPITRYAYEVAKSSVDIALTGADLLMKKSEKVIYALCRPPGHHAGPRVFGGYCYFNNAGIAADFLSKQGKVAIVDIDFHHGNGTQELLQNREDILTLSIHADPEVEYPYFWGYEAENSNIQSNKNFPLHKTSDIKAYLLAVDKCIDTIKEFAPEYLIIAAGFDTHKDDPVGGFNLELEDFIKIGEKFAKMDLPTLICQEGGYNIETLGKCVYNFLSPFARTT